MARVYAYMNKFTYDFQTIENFEHTRKPIDSTFSLSNGNGSYTQKMSIRGIKSLISGLYIGDEFVSAFMPLLHIVPHRKHNEKFLLMLDSPVLRGIICGSIVTRVVLDYNGFRVIDINDPEGNEFVFERKINCY